MVKQHKNLHSVHARTGRKNFTLRKQNQEKEVHEQRTETQCLQSKYS